MYDCLRDAEFRLLGTIVMYKDEYRYVESVGIYNEKIKLTLLGVNPKISLDNKSLRMRGISTGYINVLGAVTYLSRKPARRYRQGLRSDNCEFLQGHNYRHFAHWVMKGCPKEALHREDKILSKDFAIVRGELFYRARSVGIFNGIPRLGNRFKFLSEALERATTQGVAHA